MKTYTFTIDINLPVSPNTQNATAATPTTRCFDHLTKIVLASAFSPEGLCMNVQLLQDLSNVHLRIDDESMHQVTWLTLQDKEHFHALAEALHALSNRILQQDYVTDRP